MEAVRSQGPWADKEGIGWYGGAGLGVFGGPGAFRVQGLVGQRGEKVSAGVIFEKPLFLYTGAAVEHLRQGDRWYAGPEVGVDLALASVRLGWAIPANGTTRDHRVTVTIGIAIPPTLIGEVGGMIGFAGGH